MCFKYRVPEGPGVDEKALGIFSRVSSLTARAAGHRIRHILGESIKDGMRVLDIGTGPGTIPLNLKRSFPKAHFIGMDISRTMINMARDYGAKGGIEFPVLMADGQCLPFGPASIDCVISLFAMHHMDQPGRLLKEIDRVLKSDGRLLVIDFRRDINGMLFSTINTLWQMSFLFSAGRTGFADSVRSAWLPGEIETILKKENLDRFRVLTNRLELWVTS